MTVNDLSTVNAVLNIISFTLLIFGYSQIKKGNREAHKKVMLSALTTSALFLISYLIYHRYVGSVPYPHQDWTRSLYFIILVPHITLAAAMVPFILVAVWAAIKSNFERHAIIMRWTLPVWLYVSISGVLVYIMLYA